MTTLTVTLTNVCAGGNHLTFSVTGDATATVYAVRDDLSSTLTDEEKRAFVEVIMKMAKMGRTLNQASTLLQAGVVVTV